MILKINPIIAGIILLGLLFILFLLFRGCQHNKSLQSQLTTSQVELDSVKLRHEADSMAAKENEKNYNVSLEYANGVIVLRENQRDATETRLLATTVERDNYKKKYEAIKPDTDTSSTFVPNEFIVDAHDCFDKVEEKNNLIKLYVRENRELDSSYKIKFNIQANRIKQLGHERDGAILNFNDCMSVANMKLKALQPRRKVLLSLGVIWAPMPKAVGAGLIYQDKRGRQFGAKAYASSWGTLGETEVNLPLSLKKR